MHKRQIRTDSTRFIIKRSISKYCFNFKISETSWRIKKNPYIFGLPGQNKERYRYLKVCALMRKFAEECNASRASTLRGTILRKHVATYCIQLNLNEGDVSNLATFMRHSDKIHKD